MVNGKPTTSEHFGFTDGFGNPEYAGIERSSQPGQGKLMPDGSWAPLATGELLLGYADEAGELPAAPIPALLAKNGTFMVYRKLHQNLATFRAFLDRQAALYAGGKEKLAAKFIGRWRDGTPLELSPDRRRSRHRPGPRAQHQLHLRQPTPTAPAAPSAPTSGASIPRDAFGFNGRLIDRRRITRRGLAYGRFAAEDEAVSDTEERGILFMALNANLARQFEFVQQQWIQYGNDARLGNEKDILMGQHGGSGRYMVQGDRNPDQSSFYVQQSSRLHRIARRRLLLRPQHHRTGHDRHGTR